MTSDHSVEAEEEQKRRRRRREMVRAVTVYTTLHKERAGQSTQNELR